MRNKLLIMLFSIAMLTTLLIPVSACADSVISTSSREAVLMSEDGQVLFEHNGTEKRPIASMTKIMTLLRVYDAIDAGKPAGTPTRHISLKIL